MLEVIALVDLGLAYLRGVREDGVFAHGFDVINHTELTTYLRGAGAHDLTLGSGFVRAPTRTSSPSSTAIQRPDLEAGTGLRMLLRLLLASSGAVFWRMNAGAGDTVVAPMHQALERRGVAIEFFHVLRSVEVDPDSKQVLAIEFGVQATVAVTAPDGRYSPLVDLDGLEVWPTTPGHDQLVQGAELQQQGVDLESAWNDWPDVSTLRLERGRDFDTLVLGLPPSCLPMVAPDVLASSASLALRSTPFPPLRRRGSNSG